MADTRPKSDRRRASVRAHAYGCAEDLCDPYEAARGCAEDGGTATAKPRARAVRLMDELGKAPASAPMSAGVAGMNVCAPVAADGADSGADGENCTVLSVKPAGDGEVMAVVLALPRDGAAVRAAVRAPAQTTERVRLYLLAEQYADLRPRVGDISREEAEELLAAGQLCAAVRRGMQLLQYGDLSERRMAYKLAAKGVDRETAAAAAAYLAEKHYIHEDDTARRRAEQGVRKLWGPRRIREDLRAGGFTDDAVADAMESLSGVDFEANCAAVIRKKYRSVPADHAARQKMIAALLRLGYGMDAVRAACAQVEREG